MRAFTPPDAPIHFGRSRKADELRRRQAGGERFQMGGVGLLFTLDGERLVPSYTVKRGKTYRKCCSRRLAEVGGLLRGDVVVSREQSDISSRRQGRCRKFSFRQPLPEMARPPDVGTVGRRVQPDQRK